MSASIRRLQLNRSTTLLRQNSPDNARLALASVGEARSALALDPATSPLALFERGWSSPFKEVEFEKSACSTACVTSRGVSQGLTLSLRQPRYISHTREAARAAAEH